MTCQYYDCGLLAAKIVNKYVFAILLNLNTKIPAALGYSYKYHRDNTHIVI